MQQEEQHKTTLFSVCASTDLQWLEQWEAHLRPLELAGWLTVRSVRHLQVGTDRLQFLHDHLDHAAIIVLLLSADFFNNDECFALMERALARHQQGRAKVIPLLLRPVAWRETELAPLTPWPSDGHPVTQWHDPEAAFDDCVRELRRTLGRPTTAPLAHQKKRISIEEQNRVRMLGRLWHTYEDLFAQSLQGLTQIELGLSDKPDEVHNAAQLLFQTATRPEKLLPPGTSILDVYDKATQALLILGKPGAGKSTLLVELARQLVIRANSDETHPLPVILPLSSWAVKRPPLEIWLAEQVALIYDIPKKVAQRWVSEDQILPLLDGLDEMEDAARPDCVATINAYHREHLRLPLVVCSRQAEYEEAAKQQHLALQSAVVIQPLTHEYVQAYLSNAGPTLSTLNAAIQKSITLQELATTPLMLSVLSIAYQNASPDEFQITDTDERQVFALYIQRMLTRHRTPSRYRADQTKKWLARLAEQMEQRGQTAFYLEQLQKDWCPYPKIYRFCIGLISGIVAGLFTFLMFGAVYFLQLYTWSDKIAFLSVLGLFNVGFSTFLYGVVLNWVDTPAQPTKRLLSFIKRQLARLLEIRLVYGTLSGITNGILLTFYQQFISFSYILLIVLAFSVGGAFIGRADAPIRPAEAIQWSWKNIHINGRKFFGMSLLVGFLFSAASSFGLIDTLIYSYRHSDPGYLALAFFNYKNSIQFLLTVFSSSLGFSIIFILIGGISYSELGKDEHLTPNQGIRRSVRNSLVLGLSSGLLVGLITALLFGPLSSWINEITLGRPYSLHSILVRVGWGICCGIALLGGIGLRNGGLASLQHYLLRFLLWRTDVLPWHTIHFLNEATSRILLYRVGGGYRFIHQIFLSYFASLASSAQPTSQEEA